MPTCYLSKTRDFCTCILLTNTKRKQPPPPCRARRPAALASCVSESFDQNTLAVDQEKRPSRTRAAVAVFIPAFPACLDPSRKPNQSRPSTKLKPFWRRRARWDRSLLSSESRFHARFPIRLTAQGTAPRNSSAWSCRPVGGSEVPIHLHTTSHPILRFEGGTTVSSTRPGNWTW